MHRGPVFVRCTIQRSIRQELGSGGGSSRRVSGGTLSTSTCAPRTKCEGGYRVMSAPSAHVRRKRLRKQNKIKIDDRWAETRFNPLHSTMQLHIATRDTSGEGVCTATPVANASRDATLRRVRYVRAGGPSWICKRAAAGAARRVPVGGVTGGAATVRTVDILNGRKSRSGPCYGTAPELLLQTLIRWTELNSRSDVKRSRDTHLINPPVNQDQPLLR